MRDHPAYNPGVNLFFFSCLKVSFNFSIFIPFGGVRDWFIHLLIKDRKNRDSLIAGSEDR